MVNTVVACCINYCKFNKSLIVPRIFQAATVVLTIDNSRVIAGVFKQRALKFSLMMVNVTRKQAGETLSMYIMNEYCEFGWYNLIGIS